MINGSFSRKSDKLEKIPYIKSSYVFDIEDYLNLTKIDDPVIFGTFEFKDAQAAFEQAIVPGTFRCIITD